MLACAKLFIGYNMRLFSSHYSYDALLSCQYDTQKSIYPRVKVQGSLFVIPINTCMGWYENYCSGLRYKPIKTKKASKLNRYRKREQYFKKPQ